MCVALQTLEATQAHLGRTEPEAERGAGQVSAPVGAVGTSGRGVQLELKVLAIRLLVLLLPCTLLPRAPLVPSPIAVCCRHTRSTTCDQAPAVFSLWCQTHG